MGDQTTLKNDLSNGETQSKMEIVVANTLIDAVMEDACSWVRALIGIMTNVTINVQSLQLATVVAIDGFNCSSSHFRRLVAQITVQQSIDEIKVALKEYKKLKEVGSCEWIKCKFWCNTEFTSITTVNSTTLIDYMKEYNDATCDDFNEDGCCSCHSLM